MLKVKWYIWRARGHKYNANRYTQQIERYLKMAKEEGVKMEAAMDRAEQLLENLKAIEGE